MFLLKEVQSHLIMPQWNVQRGIGSIRTEISIGDICTEKHRDAQGIGKEKQEEEPRLLLFR